jgi:hypothetical protein
MTRRQPKEDNPEKNLVSKHVLKTATFFIQKMTVTLVVLLVMVMMVIKVDERTTVPV